MLEVQKQIESIHSEYSDRDEIPWQPPPTHAHTHKHIHKYTHANTHRHNHTHTQTHIQKHTIPNSGFRGQNAYIVSGSNLGQEWRRLPSRQTSSGHFMGYFTALSELGPF
jgi:hypothetical protein